VHQLLKGSELLITSIHEVTATPWFISLPLVAVVVNLVIRAPVSLYSNSMQRRKAKLGPLVQAQYAQIGLGLRRKAVPNVMDRVTKAVRKRSKKMFAAFAVNESRSIWGGLVGLPIFLSNLEVIRTMCGGPRGMLGGLLYGWQGQDTAGTAVSGTATTAGATASPTTPNAIPGSPTAELPSGAGIGDIASSTAGPEILSPLTVEPSFASGGCLWFPDLLVPDPYHILAFAVSGLLLVHLIPETEAELRALFGMRLVDGSRRIVIAGARSRGSLALRRALMVLALAIGPVTMDLPVALHLYWASSLGCSLLVTKGIRRLFPIERVPVKPCSGLEIPLLRPKPN
jgi:mitochondrial inner membrane protein COX18